VSQRHAFRSLARRAREPINVALDPLLERGHRRSEAPPVERSGEGEGTEVDAYWSGHTVRAERFRTVRQSERFLRWRFGEYPLFQEFCDLWGSHDDEVVLDYGCGPGNDVVGLAAHTGAREVIGIDVSPKALALARDRVALHGIEPGRVRLIQATDGDPGIPLETGSVDYLQSMGVIHHTSEPETILAELHRVLRPGGRACVMVYNRDSVWFHLYTAYERMIVDDAFPGLDVDDAFTRNTDGPDCPISRAYRGPDFLALCEQAGFEGRFVGGYLSRREIQSLDESWATALADERLGEDHREFLRGLTRDPVGLPTHGGYHAGIGGVYRLAKPSVASAR